MQSHVLSSWFKRLAISFAALTTVCVVGPWLLYWAGLYDVDGRPELPTYSATKLEQKAVWEKLGGIDQPNVISVTPYTYFFVADGNAYEAKTGILAAWKVAANFNQGHLKYKGMLWWHLSGAALTIWVTRNWSADQVLSKVVENEHATAGLTLLSS